LKTSCDNCGSSDGNHIYHDHEYCFVCNHTKRYKKGDANLNVRAQAAAEKAVAYNNKKEITPLPEKHLPLEDRGIGVNAAKKFKVTYIDNTADKYVHIYPYTRNGKHTANKKRFRDKKDFLFEGDATRLDLFGQSVFPAGSARSITVVEGECDALAAYEMNGGFPVVSVRSSSQAVTDVKNNFEYLNSFDEIVICFDADEAKYDNAGKAHYPGQEAAIKVAEQFPLGKVRIVTLSQFKDPNDYLRAGKEKEFKNEWFRAGKYTPAGLKLGSEIWDDIINPPQHETILYPYEGLNVKTYGIRLSELIVVNAPPKVGKTTLLGTITHHILRNTEDAKVGLMKLEESNRDTALNLMSIEAGKRLHLPDVWDACDPKDIKKYYDATVNTDRIVIWDHFGSNAVQAVLDKIHHMHALGCKYIILDHISILVSDQSGDERKQLDEISTKIKTLCMELNICVIAVVHQNRDGQIRGTQGIEQLANIVIRLERDKMASSDAERNTTKVFVTENRFCGETGLACHLYYDPETGIQREISEEQANQAKMGEAPW